MLIRSLIIALFLFAFGIQIVTGSSVTTRFISSGKDFSFPVFSSKSSSAAVARINRFLQLSELYALVGPQYPDDPFEQVLANDGSMYGAKAGLLPIVITTNSRVISVGFDQAACGATCGYWRSYYTFNRANGDRIGLRDLFNEVGVSSVLKMMTRKSKQKLRSEIVRKVPADERQILLENLGCSESEDPGFWLTDRGIGFDSYDCLHKSQKFYGIDTKTHLSLAQFKSHLNKYGRAVFGLSNRSLGGFRSQGLPQLFEGTVGDVFPIAMVIDRDPFGNEIMGMYAYLKYGRGLSLRGRANGSSLELTESVLSPTTVSNELGEIRRRITNAKITGELSAGGFEGSWSSIDETEQLSFRTSARYNYR